MEGSCGFRACGPYIFATILMALGVVLMGYLALYIYFAYVTQRDQSADLLKWRDNAFAEIDKRYDQKTKEDLANSV